MPKALLSLALLLLLAPAALATDFAGSELVVPIVGRTDGAYASRWRTDVYITNLGRVGLPPESVYLAFSPIGGPEQVAIVSIPSFGTAAIKDVVASTFGKQSANGMLRIVAVSATAKLTARARIYNIGSSTGEYGQTVHAMPVGSLSKDAMLPGLRGLGVNRSNVGIANPGSKTAGIWISLYDKDGEFFGAYSIEIAPRSIYLMNDVFSYFQNGQMDDAMIRVRSTEGVYVYGSIVRSDTGDADFVTATGVEVAVADQVVTPTCQTPAPLRLAPIPAEGWIVIFYSSANAENETAQLAARYGFTPLHVYSAGLKAFHANLTQAQIASLRCEASIQAIEQNALVPLP